MDDNKKPPAIPKGWHVLDGTAARSADGEFRFIPLTEPWKPMVAGACPPEEVVYMSDGEEPALLDLEKAKAFLLDAARQSGGWQLEHRPKIVEAFRLFWGSGPNEDEFDHYCQGLILFPAMLFIMARKDSAQSPESGTLTFPGGERAHYWK